MLACAFASVAIASTGWAVYRDQANGFSIAAPTGWVMVPGSRPAALSLAASFEKKGESRKASLVRSFLADNSQSGEDRVVDGVQYPVQTSPMFTDFVLVKDHLPKGLASDQTTLRLIGNAIFDEFAKQSGAKLTTASPRQIRLSSRTVIEFSGAIPAVGFGGRKAGFAFYILLGPNRTEWQIEFRTDSRRLGADASLFRRIAASLHLA
jgi:hypothetical protein